ncbi:MFS transporter [Gluconacetobacter azotocaptans]|uniref:MFS transporter n=1 Tax=Gluconacetobacter azotocaptans TaxID=142834 RepID=UPI001FD457AA|nr:MFS transporter [Gluconacetobacter azotocaptans]GBQ27438.1 major facilitator superfamily transporter [Gluconacetobacter azotocaptans DSM 13594]
MTDRAVRSTEHLDGRSAARPSAEAALPPAEARILRAAAWRIIPLLILCYMFSYLDRINLSFARQPMEHDLNFSDATFGLGAGLFFVGYIAFQVPSSVLLMRFGARRTIAAIMIGWSLISFLFTIVDTVWQFCALRVLLGVAEAGFYPAVLYYLALWFSRQMLGRVTSGFLIAIPLSGALGGPVSVFILSRLDGAMSVPGWKWMFVIEALPALLLGFVLLRWLDDGPADAGWLDESQRRLLLTRAPAGEGTGPAGAGGRTPRAFTALTRPLVPLLIVICFCQAVCNYGIVFWIPTFIAQVLAVPPSQVGLYTTLPFLTAILAMTLNARSSDRRQERRWHMAAPFLAVSVLLVLAFLFQGHGAVALLLLTGALAAALCVTAMIFTIPALVLEKGTLATSLAWINSLGALGGLIGPYAIGWLRVHTGQPLAGLFLVAVCAGVGGVATLRLPR